MGQLTVAKVRGTATPGRYADGNTLYLHIAPGGSKSWVQRITVKGRRRDLGLGPWPAVSLAEARTRALANRVLVERGGDPLARKRKAVPTFREAAQRTYEANRPRWRSAKVAAVWMQRAERHAFPTLGDLRVDAIGREEVLRVLTPIWTAKPETARKVRAIIRSTLAWAEAHGHVERNMAGDAIDGALPAQPAVQAHFRTVPHAKVAAALQAVEASGAAMATKLCFRFLVLTVARSGEAREAVWSEMDLEARTWTVPAERMKSNREHVVPLSDGAMAVLSDAARLRETGGDLVFPGVKRGRPLSDATLSKLLKEIGVPAVPHGFRAAFRTWASERTDAPQAVMELALAHASGTQVERAYARSDLRDKRRALMQRWAEYVTTTGGKVVRLHA